MNTSKALQLRAALAAASLFAAAVPAAAQQAPSTSTVFYACYVPGTGTLYRIKEANLPAQCARGHVEFSWGESTRTNSEASTLTPMAAGGGGGKPGGGGTTIMVGDAAGGDLSGTYPNPSVAKIQGQAVSATAPTAGQVLTWDGTAWTAKPVSGGVTAHGQLTGLGNDDHTQYLLANGNRTAPNGFAVTGTVYSGSIAASGAGTRVLWYPGKAAFRAGIVDGAQWDDNNMAAATTAFGYNTMANATYATALGIHSVASGSSALAAGSSAAASGTAAVALGSSTRASGSVATALGNGTTASGSYALAAGYETVASGDASIAIGRLTTSAGFASTAIGEGSGANGRAATAIGSGVFADGDYTIAMGRRASTRGHAGSFVFGDFSSTSDVNVTAANQFVVRASGGFIFYTHPALSSGVSLASGAGAWSTLSDVSRKENFRAVDGDEVLDKLAEMEIREWNYTSQDASIRHLGPTAQDFHAAFGLGESETTISTVDADGISLLGIQMLTRRLARQQEEIASLQTTISRLEERLARLEAPRGDSVR